MKAAIAAGLFGLVTLSQSPAPSPAPPPKATPRLEAVAETKLLMAGLAHPNFKGLDRLLRQPPPDNQAWTFARGQALLIAETGNLLMMRPPKNAGQDVWFQRGIDLRRQATELARSLSQKDYNGSRAGLVGLANSCNRCHVSFRIPVQIEPFAAAAPP